MKSSQYFFDPLDSCSSSRYKYFNGSKDLEVNHGSPVFNTSPSRNYFSKSKRNEESNNNSMSKETIISVSPPFFNELASSKEFMEDRKIKFELLRNVKKPNYELNKNILDSLNCDSLLQNNDLLNDESNIGVFESFNQEAKINLPKGDRKEFFPTKLPSNECNRYKATPEFQKFQTRTSSQKIINPFFRDKQTENSSFFKKSSEKNKENEPNMEKKKELKKYFDLPLQYTKKRTDSFYKDASETMDEKVEKHNEISFDFNHKFYNNFLKNKENNLKVANNYNGEEDIRNYNKNHLDSERLTSPILSINFKDNNLKSNTSNETTTACFSSMENTDANQKCNPFYVFNMELISSHCLSPVDKEKIINLIQNNINDVKIVSSNDSVLCDKTNLNLKKKEFKIKPKEDAFDLPNRQARNKSLSKISTEDSKLANQRKHSLNSINHQKTEQYLSNKKNSVNFMNLINYNFNTSELKKNSGQNNSSEAYKKTIHGLHRKAISNLDGKENLNDSNYLKRVKVKDIITEFESFKHDYNPNQAKIGDERNIVFEKKELKQILNKKQLFTKRAELELKPNLKPVKINLF